MQLTNIIRSVSVLCMAGILLTACNSNDSESSSSAGPDSSTASGKVKNEAPSGEMNKIVTDVCDCISKMEDELSAKSKKIFVDASKTSDPQSSIQQQLMAMEPEERMEIAEDFRSFENSPAQNCFKDLEKKYPEMQEDNEEKKRELIKKVQDAEAASKN